MTQSEWIKENAPGFGNYKTGYDWYYQEYPFLTAKKFTLPIPENLLKDFYVEDMNQRNVTPVKEVVSGNSYDVLFGYFLENYTKPNSEKAGVKAFGTYLLENIPNGIIKTGEQLSGVVSGTFDKLIIAVVIIAVVGIAILIYSKQGN